MVHRLIIFPSVVICLISVSCLSGYSAKERYDQSLEYLISDIKANKHEKGMLTFYGNTYRMLKTRRPREFSDYYGVSSAMFLFGSPEELPYIGVLQVTLVSGKYKPIINLIIQQEGENKTSIPIPEEYNRSFKENLEHVLCFDFIWPYSKTDSIPTEFKEHQKCYLYFEFEDGSYSDPCELLYFNIKNDQFLRGEPIKYDELF